MNMRVAILHNYTLSGSGSSTYVLGLVKSLVKLGHHVVVISRELDYEKYGCFGSVFSHDGEGIIPVTPRGPSAGANLAVGYSLTFEPYVGIETHPECRNAAYFSSCSQSVLDEYLLKSIKAVKDIVHAESIEILNANHEVPLPYVAARVKEVTGIPFIATLHGSHIEYVLRRDPIRYRPYVEEGLASASCIIVTTKSVQDRCIANASVDPARFVLIPVGVDTSRFKPRDLNATPLFIENEIDHKPIDLREISNHGPVVAFIGKATADKGLHLMPYLLAGVTQRIHKARLLIVGGGDLLETLLCFARGEISSDSFLSKTSGSAQVVRDYLAHHPAEWDQLLKKVLEQQCVVLGAQPFEIVQNVLSIADVCVIPSLIDEALPMVTLEALSSGSLPIVRNYSGFKEIIIRIKETVPELAPALSIGAETTTLLSDFVDCTTNALEEFSNPQQKALLVQALRNLAVSEYDWQIIASRISSLYEKAAR